MRIMRIMIIATNHANIMIIVVHGRCVDVLIISARPLTVTLYSPPPPHPVHPFPSRSPCPHPFARPPPLPAPLPTHSQTLRTPFQIVWCDSYKVAAVRILGQTSLGGLFGTCVLEDRKECGRLRASCVNNTQRADIYRIKRGSTFC